MVRKLENFGEKIARAKSQTSYPTAKKASSVKIKSLTGLDVKFHVYNVKINAFGLRLLTGSLLSGGIPETTSLMKGTF